MAALQPPHVSVDEMASQATRQLSFAAPWTLRARDALVPAAANAPIDFRNAQSDDDDAKDQGQAKQEYVEHDFRKVRRRRNPA